MHLPFFGITSRIDQNNHRTNHIERKKNELKKVMPYYACVALHKYRSPVFGLFGVSCFSPHFCPFTLYSSPADRCIMQVDSRRTCAHVSFPIPMTYFIFAYMSHAIDDIFKRCHSQTNPKRTTKFWDDFFMILFYDFNNWQSFTFRLSLKLVALCAVVVVSSFDVLLLESLEKKGKNDSIPSAVDWSDRKVLLHCLRLAIWCELRQTE